jgi:Tol biopolymer transport system component
MNSMQRIKIAVGAVFFCGLLTLSGCFFEILSWSPDGRFLVTPGPKMGILLRYDTQSGKTEELAIQRLAEGKREPLPAAIVSCHYLPDGKGILLLTDKGGKDGGESEEESLYFYEVSQNLATRIDSGVGPYLDVTPDGKNVYYVVERETDGVKNYLVQKYEVGKGVTTAYTTPVEIAFPRIVPDGKNLLFSTEKGLYLYDQEKQTSRSLVAVTGKKAFYWPTWVDQKTLLYVKVPEEDNKDFVGTLEILDVETSKTQTLAPDAHAFFPLSLSPDKKQVAFTQMARDAQGNLYDDDTPYSAQIAIIDLASGKEIRRIKRLPVVCAPAFSPDGKRLAFTDSMEDDDRFIQILNLETNKTAVLWGNSPRWNSEPGRLFTKGYECFHENDPKGALESWNALLTQYPTSTTLCKQAGEGILLIRLDEKSPYFNLDAALEAFARGGSRPLPDSMRDLLWRAEDRLAVDPKDDLIQTYGTSESQKTFGFPTDQARDLRALWVRCGQKRLYVRVDYESERDLDGLKFQDTTLLFNRDGETGGITRISPGAEWDLPAQCQVLLRHWHESGKESQYDVEIRNERGEARCRFLASGYEPAGNPLIQLVGTTSGDSPSAVWSISLEALGLNEGASKVNVQACTFKGGIETYWNLEKPRIAVKEGRPVCDVADTFGADNTRERIEADLKKAAPVLGDTPPEPAVIHGVAGSFSVPKPSDVKDKTSK